MFELPGPFSVSVRAEAEEPVIVDTHIHLWFIATSDLYWLAPEMRAEGGTLIRNYVVDDFRHAAGAIGIDRAVLVQAWHAVEENMHWLRVADECDMIGAVVCWADLTNPRVGEVMDQFASHRKFRGFRACGEDEADSDWLARDDVRRGIREVGSRGNFSLDLLVKMSQLKDVPRLADENPDLPMVLNHLAKPQTSAEGYFEPWAEAMRLIADIPNLHVKISGMLTEAGPSPTADLLRPAVQFAIDTFGFDRLMWGSDWPVCLLAGSYKINFDTTLGGFGRLSPSERRRLLGDNARKFYRIG